MVKRNNEKAEAAYTKAAQDSEDLLAFIGQQLEMHKDHATLEGIHWGHVGDIQHTRETLMKLMILLLGSDSEEEGRKMIEEAIAEAHA